MNKKSVITIVSIWFAWVLIVLGFQAWSTARFEISWPDRALSWTTTYTDSADYQNTAAYLIDPFMNDQVAWDSEYYLGIAVGGYNDPLVKHITPLGVVPMVVGGDLSGVSGAYSLDNISLAYAFFPMYPWVTRLVSFPLRLLDLTPIATATLAGVIVSALGALAGMLALYDLTRDSLGEDGGLRAAFYLIIFPTGFFLCQVYTEGLFVGLAFGSLALLKRGRWAAAALLGAAATLTRAVGAALFIPMFVTWVRTGDWLDTDMEWRQGYYYARSTFKAIAAAFRRWTRRVRPGDPGVEEIRHDLAVLISFGKMLVVFSPAITFLVWKFSYLGQAFSYVEDSYFGRGFLALGQSYYVWATAFEEMLRGTNPARTAYYLIEFGAILLGLAACIVSWKRYPELAWFSLAVFILSLASGGAQGMHRYILGAPVVFMTLAGWGRRPAFDRAWSLLSILLMAVLAMLFAFNYWVA